MKKVYLYFLRVLFCFLLIITLVYSRYCFAEIPNTAVSNDSAKIESNETIVNFSQGASGFHLNDEWKIQNEELQFAPNEIRESRFYCNLFQDLSATDYQISTNARWIKGPDYSAYGLVFGYHYDCYYTFLIALNNHLVLYKYDNNRWKKMKEAKNPITSASYDDLKVICQGSLIQCFIHDKKLFEVKDKNFDHNGFVGLCADGEVQCGFKDFRVNKL
jgi:hypothetical protein